ncbi:integrase [Schaalia cardiffensis F0333]|uniref:Integrase n=1 Tax=Schaalia cardiffensis F0333 TaxID=888050 RepID=N6X409_9ACTO|nr:integrase [Schaalia cardiffensis F0333]
MTRTGPRARSTYEKNTNPHMHRLRTLHEARTSTRPPRIIVLVDRHHHAGGETTRGESIE